MKRIKDFRVASNLGQACRDGKPFFHRCVSVPFTYQHEPHSNFVPKPNIDAESINNMSNDLFIQSSNWTEKNSLSCPMKLSRMR